MGHIAGDGKIVAYERIHPLRLTTHSEFMGLRRTNMKKLVATVAALAFTISFAACGEAGEKAAEETTEAAEAAGEAVEAGAENAMTAAEGTADATAEAAGEAADATADAADNAMKEEEDK